MGTEEMIAAAKAGDRAEVARLLDADPSLATAPNMFGSQPAHAAYLSGHGEVFDLLLSRGVTLDSALAAELGMLDVVRADAEAAARSDSRGVTLLHRACYWGQIAVAEYLLPQGADPNLATRDGFLDIRPLGSAVASPDVPNPSDREEVVLALVQLLLKHDADPNGRRRDGLTALHGAAWRGHVQVLKALLAAGADPSLRGTAGPHAGQTALDIAVSQNQTAAADFLRGITPKEAHRS